MQNRNPGQDRNQGKESRKGIQDINPGQEYGWSDMDMDMGMDMNGDMDK